MKLIVGLGNPGEKFKYTRHNIGFMVVEKLAKELLPVGRSEKAWVVEKKFAAEVCKLQHKQEEIILAKPQTYMNLVGLSVSRIVNFYKVKPEDIWVVHDDIDLPLGKIRIRKGGASAGHHGIESIIKELKTSDFIRIRLGIGRGKVNLQHSADRNLHRREIERYVLSLFRENEGGEVKRLLKQAVEALESSLDKGIEKAANRFN